MHFWRFSAATDVGLQRNNNEDTYLSSPEVGLWVVADGMGGHAAGEVASAIVSETIDKEVQNGASLSDAIQASHRQVLTAAANGEGGQGMGSTVVALHSNGHHYEVAWVGDSRAYLWSPNKEESESRLTQLSTDHSYVQMLFQTGAISEDELETHPEKNIITQCLGSVELDTVTVDQVEGAWNSGEKILLCSDGLSDVVSAKEIDEILLNKPIPEEAIRELISLALARGGRDNVTVSLVERPSPILIFLQSIRTSLSKFFS